jgi:hypothetical protein
MPARLLYDALNRTGTPRGCPTGDELDGLLIHRDNTMQQLRHSFDIRRWCGLSLVSATILGLLLLPGTPPAAAATVTLYDGALNTGTPGTQGFSYLTEPIVSAQASQSFANGTTTLTTTLQISDKAGYFAKSNLMPQLDRTAGYTVRFTTQVLEENHSNNNRAGLSVIVLGSDLRGIELGFWEDQVWAQSGADFTHAETAALDTTTGLIAYELRILGNSYTLTGGGATLSGSLRDYSAEGPPYTLANFLFLGDDTTSASARIRLTKVDIITGGAPTATATGTARSLYLPAVVRPTGGASR